MKKKIVKATTGDEDIQPKCPVCDEELINGKCPHECDQEDNAESEKVKPLEDAVASRSAVRAGDSPGHEFHGNQWSGATGGQEVEHSGEKFHYNEDTKRFHDKKGEPVGNLGLHEELHRQAHEDNVRKAGASKPLSKDQFDALQKHGYFKGQKFKPGIRGSAFLYCDVVQCRNSGVVLSSTQKWEVDKPVKFQWMPGGKSTINAHFRDGSIELTVKCDEATARTVQASYERWFDVTPNQEPFGCIEHREEEAALRLPKGVARFDWDNDRNGIQCTAVPSGLGARNVNQRIHRSWSPSFTTDAEYDKCSCANCDRNIRSCECADHCVAVFPAGARGHEDTPANITGVAFSVGSLTNKPAFKNILPVRAKEAGTGRQPPQAEHNNADNTKGLTMKVKFIKASACGKYAKDAVVTLEGDELTKFVHAGEALDYVTAERIAAQDTELNAIRAERKASRENVIKGKVAKAKEKGAILPKDTEIEASALAKVAKFDGSSPDQQNEVFELVCAQIDGMEGKDKRELRGRITKMATDDGTGFRAERIDSRGVSLQDAAAAYVKAQEPTSKLVRGGQTKQATECSREAAVIMKHDIMSELRGGNDFILNRIVKGADSDPGILMRAYEQSIVRGADYTDPNSQVGTLATGLVLMRNLGFLRNKLNWLPYFSTDLRNEPAMFGQPVLTRYIGVPGVLTWIPGVGFTSDASTISTASAGTVQSGIVTQASGTVTKSVPSNVDVVVTMNQFKATEIEFPISTLAATARNLFAENRGAQIYGLAEHINQHVLGKIFAATWGGTVTSCSIANLDLKGYLTVKNRMELSKIPDVGRYALLHSYFYDGLQADGSLLTSKAILALINKDQSSYEDADMPPIFGVKPLGSQLAVGTSGSATLGTATIATDGSSVTFGANNIVGFAGNMSSMLFVARVPMDFNQAATQLGIPATNAVEVITEPDSGLSLMVFKYVDNGKMSISHRVCLMYGAAQGDPRIGMVLRPT